MTILRALLPRAPAAFSCSSPRTGIRQLRTILNQTYQRLQRVSQGKAVVYINRTLFNGTASRLISRQLVYPSTRSIQPATTPISSRQK